MFLFLSTSHSAFWNFIGIRASTRSQTLIKSKTDPNSHQRQPSSTLPQCSQSTCGCTGSPWSWFLALSSALSPPSWSTRCTRSRTSSKFLQETCRRDIFLNYRQHRFSTLMMFSGGGSVRSSLLNSKTKLQRSHWSCSKTELDKKGEKYWQNHQTPHCSSWPLPHCWDTHGADLITSR